MDKARIAVQQTAADQFCVYRIKQSGRPKGGLDDGADHGGYNSETLTTVLRATYGRSEAEIAGVMQEACLEFRTRG
jgi:hypothetical protein